MKKLLLALGSIAAVAAPVASVVACGAPKQKHIPLDTTVVTKLLPKLKTAAAGILPSAITEANFDDGTVTATTDGNVKVVFVVTMTADHSSQDQFTIIVTPDGNITSANGGGSEISGDSLQKLKDIVKDGTIDHSGDDTDVKNTLVASDYDQKIMGSMTAQFPTPLSSGASAADKHTYNDQADAFLAEYKPLIAKAAYDILAGDNTLLISEADYNALTLAETELNAEIIKNIGFNAATAEKLQNLIDHGAKIFIGKSGQDISGSVEDYSGSFSWIHGSGLAHDAIGVVSLSDLASTRKTA